MTFFGHKAVTLAGDFEAGPVPCYNWVVTNVGLSVVLCMIDEVC